MSKTKTVFLCQKCGYQSPKWEGRCPECGAWNSFSEDSQVISTTKSKAPEIKSQPESLFSIKTAEERLTTKFTDIDVLLGGGIKKGSLILLSGEPGIGKSTLTLQLCQSMAESKQNVLYVSGEESPEQISSRAARLQISHEAISVVGDSNLESVMHHIKQQKPEFVIIDSIQVLSSLDLPSMTGSINQVRYCTETLMEYAKTTNTTMIIIGHVTKDGNLAGPRVLEHLVDTVLFLEGERYQHLRILRSLKNRFGSTNDVSIMAMESNGLQEVASPSEMLLQGRKEGSIGSAVTVTLEGSKPLLLEVQALTNPTVFGYPKRTASGYDMNRAHLLAAVLSKYLKLNLNSQDLYINTIGGIKLRENAADLAVAMAIASSFKKIPLPEKTVFLGEIGLSGEIRPVPLLEKRVNEAKKLGFTNIVTPDLAKSLEHVINLI